MNDVGREFLRDAAARFEEWRQRAEKATDQLEDAQLYWKPDPEANSIAVLLAHLAGNLRSRWRDFLTSDGEKPDRDRDAEFEVGPGTGRDQLMAAWHAAWELQRMELARVRPEDLLRTVTIRGQPETVLAAIDRQMLHLVVHVGQIIYIAKHLRGADWQTLSIPRGQSKAFAEKLRGRP